MNHATKTHQNDSESFFWGSDGKIAHSPFQLSGLFLKVRFVAKLKCPHVGYVLAFAKDFLASCLELLQGFQHVVLIQTSL